MDFNESSVYAFLLEDSSKYLFLNWINGFYYARKIAQELLIPIVLFFFSLKFLCFFPCVFAFLSSYVFPLSSNFTWITLTVGLSNHVFLALQHLHMLFTI